jgi:hypothetical protein
MPIWEGNITDFGRSARVERGSGWWIGHVNSPVDFTSGVLCESSEVVAIDRAERAPASVFYREEHILAGLSEVSFRAR